MFGFVLWTAAAAALMQGYSAKSVRLEVQFLRWNMTQEEVLKSRWPVKIPKDTKPEMSIVFDAAVGKEQHVETKSGNRTLTVTATVSGFSESGFLVQLSMEQRVETGGIVPIQTCVDTTLLLWPGKRFELGGYSGSTTLEGKTEAHGEAFTAQVTRPLLPIAEPFLARAAQLPLSQLPLGALAGPAAAAMLAAPVHSLVEFPTLANSAGGCGSAASSRGAMIPISNARR